MCQALVGEKLSTEPAARTIFSNTISYLASRKSDPVSKTVVLSEDDAFVQILSDLGVAYTRLIEPPVYEDLRSANLLILHGGGKLIASSAKSIRDFSMDSHGDRNIYWHEPEAEAFDKLSPALSMGDFTIVSSSGPLKMPDIRNGFLTGVCREDITYVGRSVGIRTWYRQYEPDPAIIDRCLSPAPASEILNRLELEEMDLQGVYVHPTNSGREVIFASSGTAAQVFRVTKTGYYPILVLAGGTPAEGVYPRFEISINGEISGSITLTEGRINPYALLAELPHGEVELKLAFVNDIQTATEDRNLLVDAILVGEEPIELQVMTLPLALAAKQVGSMHIVVDCLRWDTHGLVRGRRYASALLANLGASFEATEKEPSWIPLSAIEPVGIIPYFRKDDQEISLVARGTVEAQFECATEGQYSVLIRGRSTPAQGQFGIALVAVDGQKIGDAEVRTRSDGTFLVGKTQMSQGRHKVMVAFTNDLYRDGEDRNLYIKGIGFRLEED
jgi:hypothetical protein